MNVLRHEDRLLEQDTSTDADVHLDLMRRRTRFLSVLSC